MEDYIKLITGLLREVRAMPTGKMILVFVLIMFCILAWQSPELIQALK